MSKKTFQVQTFLAVAISVMVLAACGGQPTSAPTILPILPATNTPPAIISTLPPLPTVPPVTATATPTATRAPDITELPAIDDSVYLDDRSTPAAVMLSYFNAVNRREYLRAYSYYTNFSEIGTLESFSDGYSQTQSVAVVFGGISSGGAAGSIYYTVPMVLNATTSAGSQQKFAACYILRLPQPQNFGAPPITPMHIDRGTAQAVDLATTNDAALAQACAGTEFEGGPDTQPAVVEDLSDLSAANFIDNRSDPVTVFSSYVNAINLREYVRAYSYWQTPPGAYEPFAAGFEGTESVTAQFGTVSSDAGAGQIGYSLPVVMRSAMADGSVKVYAGCYVMHLSNPAIQGTVPFQPLGMVSGSVEAVDAAADAAALLATACS